MEILDACLLFRLMGLHEVAQFGSFLDEYAFQLRQICQVEQRDRVDGLRDVGVPAKSYHQVPVSTCPIDMSPMCVGRSIVTGYMGRSRCIVCG